MKLQSQDYIDAAYSLGVDVASIRALVEVESRGNGFLLSGEPVVLFERHWMYRLLKAKLKKEPALSDVVNPSAGGYLGGGAEHKRLTKAVEIDRECALQSASYGLFQIMGFNYKVCGFDTLQAFINAMFKDEAAHLNAFINFIKSNETLHKALINRDWPLVARLYNGSGYRRNAYDVKLAKSYAKWSVK